MVREYTEQDLASMEGPRDLKEQGSIPWSWQTVSALQHMWQSLHLNFEHYMTILGEAREHRIWEKIPPDVPYGSEGNMLKQVEVGNDKDAQKRMKIQTLTATARKIHQNGGDRRSEEFQSYHDNSETLGRGSGSEYILGLVARDNPEFFAQVVSGELSFTSAAAMARAAGVGFLSRKPSVSLPDNVDRVADRMGHERKAVPYVPGHVHARRVVVSKVNHYRLFPAIGCLGQAAGRVVNRCAGGISSVGEEADVVAVGYGLQDAGQRVFLAPDFDVGLLVFPPVKAVLAGGLAKDVGGASPLGWHHWGSAAVDDG